MRVIAVANQKGGVGKTTTAITLGTLLAMRGRRALLVDMDPQGSLTSYFRYEPEQMGKGVYEVFRRPGLPLQKVVVGTSVKGLALMPANTAQATLERQLGARPGKGLVLAQALHRYRDRFDVAIVDSPPVLGLLMVNALAASRQLLIPVETDFMALKGLERIMGSLAMVNKSLRRPLDARILPTLYDPRARAGVDALRQLYRKYPKLVLDEVIPEDPKFREAARQQQPAPMLYPRSPGVVAYERVLARLVPGFQPAARSG